MSVIAAALKHMMSSGMSAEAIVRAVEDMEEALRLSQPQRSKGAERQARYEERKRQKASESVRNDVNDESPRSPPNPSPTPPTNTPPISPQPKKVCAREMPIDWQPLEFGVGTHCRNIVDGWPPGGMGRQLEHFRAHHGKKGDKFKDWQKAWATWVLNSEKFGHGRQQQTGGLQRGGTPAINDLAREALEWGMAEDGFGNGGADFHDALPAPRRIGREDHAGGIRGSP